MVSMAIAIISAQKRFEAQRPLMPAHDGFLLKPALILSRTCGVCNLCSQGSTSFRGLRLFSGAFLPIESKHAGPLLFWPSTGITSRWQETVPVACITPDETLCINFSDTEIQRMGKAGKSNS